MGTIVGTIHSIDESSDESVWSNYLLHAWLGEIRKFEHNSAHRKQYDFHIKSD